MCPGLGRQTRGGTPPAVMRQEAANAACGASGREPIQLREKALGHEGRILGRQAIVVEELRREPPIAERVAGAIRDGAHGDERHVLPGRDAGHGRSLHVLGLRVRRGGRWVCPEAHGRRRGQLATEDLAPARGASNRLPVERVGALPELGEDDHRVVGQAYRRGVGRCRRNGRAVVKGRRQDRRPPPDEREQRRVDGEAVAAALLAPLRGHHDVADAMRAPGDGAHDDRGRGEAPDGAVRGLHGIHQPDPGEAEDDAHAFEPSGVVSSSVHLDGRLDLRGGDERCQLRGEGGEDGHPRSGGALPRRCTQPPARAARRHRRRCDRGDQQRGRHTPSPGVRVGHRRPRSHAVADGVKAACDERASKFHPRRRA